jgi:MFS family permease
MKLRERSAAPGRERQRERPPEPEQRSAAELTRQLTELVPRLVREELTLAQSELKEKGRHAGKSAGMFGGGALIGVYGGGALVAAMVLGLATVLDPWASALIVGVVLLAVAGVMALVGRKQVRAATPPVPEAAVENVKKDVQTMKERAHR